MSSPAPCRTSALSPAPRVTTSTGNRRPHDDHLRPCASRNRLRRPQARWPRDSPQGPCRSAVTSGCSGCVEKITASAFRRRLQQLRPVAHRPAQMRHHHRRRQRRVRAAAAPRRSADAPHATAVARPDSGNRPSAAARAARRTTCRCSGTRVLRRADDFQMELLIQLLQPLALGRRASDRARMSRSRSKSSSVARDAASSAAFTSWILPHLDRLEDQPLPSGSRRARRSAIASTPPLFHRGHRCPTWPAAR